MSDKLDKDLLPIATNNKVILVSGGARGADDLGIRYADAKGIEVSVFHPDWNKYGKSAAYLRNVEMAEEANMLLAFWDGKSKGTKHMIDIAKERGLDVIVYDY